VFPAFDVFPALDVFPVAAVFTTGFTGWTLISGAFGLLLAVELGFGSGRRSGSSAGLVGCFTRRGRLDWALMMPNWSTTRPLTMSARWKCSLIIELLPWGEVFLLR
jgi:hypothetical protein